MEEFLWKLGSFTCHLLPERCLHIQGVQMPLCSRCFAWYLSAFLAFVLVIIWWIKKKEKFYFSFTANIILLLLMSVLVIDGVTQLFGWRVSNNPLRFFSGSLFGISTILMAASIYSFHKKDSKRYTARNLFPWLAVCIAGALVLLVIIKLPFIPVEVMYFLVLIAHLGNLITFLVSISTLGIIIFKKIER